MPNLVRTPLSLILKYKKVCSSNSFNIYGLITVEKNNFVAISNISEKIIDWVYQVTNDT